MSDGEENGAPVGVEDVDLAVVDLGEDVQAAVVEDVDVDADAGAGVAEDPVIVEPEVAEAAVPEEPPEEPAGASSGDAAAPQIAAALRTPEKKKAGDERKEDNNNDNNNNNRGTASPSGKTGRAPLRVPFHRRLETCAVLTWLLVLPIALLTCFILIRSSMYTLIPFLLYVGWMMLFQEFHKNGGHAQGWFRRLFFWRWFANFFPIHLHRTAELDPKECYIFGYHPHGIISMGAMANFGTDATGFSDKFPGINNRLLTLRANFRIPFVGLYLTALGVCDASKESITSVLSRGGGNAVTLVLGGAKESLDAHPGTFDLTLRNRKGFVKMALRHGAHLVPVMSFGENDIYDQAANEQGSFLRNVQDSMQKRLGFAMPVVKGRGVFSYDMGSGLLPARVPIHTVVGEPIPVPKLSEDELTTDAINRFHKLYIDALQALYDQYKDVYAKNRRSSLRIVQ